MAKEGGFMNIKIIPVHLEMDLKNPEQPLKVQYVVELATNIYNDVMSTGVTYMADPDIAKAIENLVDIITNKIHADLGLATDTNPEPEQKEEEL